MDPTYLENFLGEFLAPFGVESAEFPVGGNKESDRITPTAYTAEVDEVPSDTALVYGVLGRMVVVAHTGTQGDHAFIVVREGVVHCQAASFSSSTAARCSSTIFHFSEILSSVHPSGKIPQELGIERITLSP